VRAAPQANLEVAIPGPGVLSSPVVLNVKTNGKTRGFFDELTTSVKELLENGPCGERIHFQARLSIAVVLSQFYTARIVFPLEATSSEPNPF